MSWCTEKPKKVLILNGSPKKNNSSTLYATKAFVDGICQSVQCDVEYINVIDLNINPCTGCLSCWGRTAGECVIKNDDIQMIKNKIEQCDIFIESYPLYFFGMPGIMKVFTDRMMSMVCTYKGQKPPVNGESFHGIRNPKNRKFIIITSCAYSDSALVYDSLFKQYDCICGRNNYLGITVPQIKTLIDLKNNDKINRYLAKFIEAGKEFGQNGFLSEETLQKIKKPPFSEAAYKVFLDKFWEQESN
ncbi:MAG: flavodoxin family protein [Anaeroplasma sp.]